MAAFSKCKVFFRSILVNYITLVHSIQQQTKYLLYLAIFFICAVLFVGCAGKPTSYIYPNQTIEVVSIEIVLNQNSENTGINEDNFDILADLNEEDFVLFTKKIQSLKTYRKRGGPLWGYGKYFARITYINGDIEILGYENIEFIKKGASPSGFGSYYYINPDELLAIFSEYTNLPDLGTAFACGIGLS